MFSIIAPLDTNRLEQFANTKRTYDKFSELKEFIIPTRSHDTVKAFLDNNDLMKDVKLIPYEHEKGFNPSKALNLGVKHATYDHIIITSPEVKPKTQVLKQLSERLGENVVCQVYDQDDKGNEAMSLVNAGFRQDSPAYYFLAMFNKSDIETINGWDEDFMLGYAYEDNDFGERWKRAGLPFTIADDIKAVHQYHLRSETIPGGANINFRKLNDNNDRGIIKPLNGMTKL